MLPSSIFQVLQETTGFCCLGVDLYITVLLSSFRYGMNETEVADLCYCFQKMY